jgi:hypothetical protein
MAGRPSGIRKKVVLLRVPETLYDQIKTEAKGLSVQSVIYRRLKLLYAPDRQDDSEKTGKETRTRRAERLDSA